MFGETGLASGAYHAWHNKEGHYSIGRILTHAEPFPLFFQPLHHGDPTSEVRVRVRVQRDGGISTLSLTVRCNMAHNGGRVKIKVFGKYNVGVDILAASLRILPILASTTLA